MSNSQFLMFNRDYTALMLANDNSRNPSYPPSEFIKTSDGAYALHMALAGFASENVSIKQLGNTISVDAKAQPLPEGDVVMRGGIARRSFERIFEFNDPIEVASATFRDGMLRVVIRLITPTPEKPRVIPVL